MNEDHGTERVMLDVQSVCSGYADLQVLRELSLQLVSGKIEVALGRNGVGKTTLLSAISGLLPLWQGRLLLDGEDVSRAPAYKRARSGIVLVQEGKRIFNRLSVLDNIALGAFTLRLSGRARRVYCTEVIERFPKLVPMAHRRAGSLSGGQQQMLAIAQALAARPRVLLLDEPSAGLSPALVGEVFEQVRLLRDAGLTVLLVEQLAEQALDVADHVTVIDNGQVVASGPTSDFHDLSGLQEAYFGERRAVV